MGEGGGGALHAEHADIISHLFRFDSVAEKNRTKLHLTLSRNTKIIKLFPARESLVSDIPAGDGKSFTFFDSV